MRAEDLYRAVGEISDEIIEGSEELYSANAAAGASDGPVTAGAAEAGEPRGSKIVRAGKRFRRWYVAVAAVACVLAGSVGIYSAMRMKAAAPMQEAAADNTEEAAEEPAMLTEEYKMEYDEAAGEFAAEEAKEAYPEAAIAEEEKSEMDAGAASVEADTGFDNPVGVILVAKNVTPNGLDLVCAQNGGNVTGELETGTAYRIERLTNGEWREVPYLSDDIVWIDEAWMIPLNDSVTWKVDWTHVYGLLSPGNYRIGKQIMVFRGPGDYDTYWTYAGFEVK